MIGMAQESCGSRQEEKARMTMKRINIWTAFALLALFAAAGALATDYTPLMPTGSRGAQTALTASDVLLIPGDLKVNTDDFIVDIDGNITLAPTGGTVTITGAATASGTVTGDTITDGTVSVSSGSVTGTWVDLGTVTTVDINGGSLDGVTIGAAAAPTVTDLGSVATCDINGGSIDGATIGAASAGAITGTTITGTTITDGTVSLSSGSVTGTWADLGAVTTVDIDGGSIDGVTIGAAAAPTVTDLGSVATCDINGGSLDGVTIGAAAAPTVTDLGSVATCDINGGTIDAATIGGGTPGAGTFTTLEATGAVTITEGALTNATVVDADIKAATITGAKIATIAETAGSGSVTAGMPQLIAVTIAGGAAANTDITTVTAVRIIDAWAVHEGGAGEASDTIQVADGSGNPITNAMDWSGNDKIVVRAGEIDDAAFEVAAAGTIRVTTTDDDSGTDVGAGVVYILAMPIP